MKKFKQTLAIVIVVLFIGSGFVHSIADLNENDTLKTDVKIEGFYQPDTFDFINEYKMITNHDKPENMGFLDKINNNSDSINYQQENKKWTWIFYDDADFYRAYDPLEDFSDEAYSNDNLDVIVLQDKENGPAKMWYVDGNHNTNVLENMGEINMGDSQTLQDLVEYAKNNFPADRYILSMYNHGGGWMGACSDDTDNDFLTMDEMQKALSETEGVDLICFTAPCLMGAIESAYELRDCVDIYIGSEELSGYGHWFDTIENICEEIDDNPDITNNELSEFIIQSLWDKTSWQPSLTMSAVKTSMMEPLISSLDTLASDLITYYNESYDLFWEVYAEVQGFGNGFCVDVYDLVNKCSVADFHPSIIEDFVEVRDCFSDCIIDECHGDYSGAYGLTIYVPDLLSYYYASHYGDSAYGLDFSQNTNWGEFVSLYFQEIIEYGVDQYQTETTTGMVLCYKYKWTQSFIPTKEDLIKLKLKLYRFGDITSDLKVSVRSEKEGYDLTTISIPYDSVPKDVWEWVEFDFPDIVLITGETYYILLSTDGGDNTENAYSFAGSNDPDSYLDGDIWLYYTSSESWKMWDPPIDACFKTFFEGSGLNPPVIEGPSSGESGICYDYSFVYNDPDNLDVSYFIDWGDGKVEEWTGPHQSGIKTTFSHVWNEKGSYVINAKAKNSDDIETGWSTLE
ncbi:MAG: hypothetical protein DRN27_08180, partial [Thermoplasmata archaeon]